VHLLFCVPLPFQLVLGEIDLVQVEVLDQSVLLPSTSRHCMSLTRARLPIADEEVPEINEVVLDSGLHVLC